MRTKALRDVLARHAVTTGARIGGQGGAATRHRERLQPAGVCKVVLMS